MVAFCPAVAAIENARERLIRNRITHLDQLAARLHQKSVRPVIEPLLEGNQEPGCTDQELEYVRDLGWIARHGPLRVANPICREYLPRHLVVFDFRAGRTWPRRVFRHQGTVGRTVIET